MKHILAFLIAHAASVPLMASSPDRDSSCGIKQQNAASFKIAQVDSERVQEVILVDYLVIRWTSRDRNNTGHSHITVKTKAEHGFSAHYAKYDVWADQVGLSTDCNIRQVNLVEEWKKSQWEEMESEK